MIFQGIQKTSFIDYPEKISTVLFTAGCNFKCPYCHNGHLVKNEVEERLTEDDIFLYLEKRRSIIEAVVVSGGEPTLFGNEIISFIKKLKERKFLVKLDTNGTNPDVLKTLIEDNLLDYIAMDVKAPESEYSRVVNTKIQITSIKKSIDIIKKSNIPYEFRTTVAKELLSKEDVLTIIKEIEPCRKYYLQNFSDGDNVLDGKGIFHSVDFLDDIAEMFSFVEVR